MALGNLPSGYLRVGSTSAPSNTTAGDLTVTRVHIGTDAVFTSSYGLELNAARAHIGGSLAAAGLQIDPTMSDAGDSTQVMAQIGGTVNGAGDNAQGLSVVTTFSPSAGVGAAYGQRFIPTYSPPNTVTLANAIGSQTIMVTGSAAGAITNLFGSYITTIYGTQKPTSANGLYITGIGAAGITTAIGLKLDKPAAATNNYYASFDTNNAAALGAYQGKLAVLVAGVAGFIPWYL